MSNITNTLLENHYLELSDSAEHYFVTNPDSEFANYKKHELYNLPREAWGEIADFLARNGNDNKNLHNYALCYMMFLHTH